MSITEHIASQSRLRWENHPAVGVRLEDLDREEILRTRQAAIEKRRLSAGKTAAVVALSTRPGAEAPTASSKRAARKASRTQPSRRSRAR